MAGPYKRVSAPNGAPVEQRLRLHMIEAPSGCWIWTGARTPAGYGQMTIGSTKFYAHRVSYEHYVGPIPDGLHIDHLCRRRACIKPMHLQPVTPRTNVLRGTSPGAAARRRDKCSVGHSFAEHGRERDGRRVCAECVRVYSVQWRAEVAAGIRVPVRRSRPRRKAVTA